MRFIGDVHGNFKLYRELIREVPRSIQVGDFGVGFKYMDYTLDEYVEKKNPPHYAMKQGDHFFIRGNHDNPEACRRHDFWIPDGTMHRGVFCVGGAGSIDAAYRIEGISWWRDEEMSYAELQACIDRYAEIKPEYVVSHDCPASVANEIMMAFNKTKLGVGEGTRQALEQMYHIHQPRLWVFGHWHHSIRFMRGRTEFVCLNELEYMDYEIEAEEECDGSQCSMCQDDPGCWNIHPKEA